MLVGEGNPSIMSLDDTQQKGWEPQEEDISKPQSSKKETHKRNIGQNNIIKFQEQPSKLTMIHLIDPNYFIIFEA